MYICVYVCILIYIYTHICTYIYTSKYVALNPIYTNCYIHIDLYAVYMHILIRILKPINTATY